MVRRSGQIVKRGDRKWVVRIYDGESGGKRVYRNFPVSGAKKDADRLLAEKLREKSLGALVLPSAMTLDAYLDKWLEGLPAAGRTRARTRQDYKQLLRLYVREPLKRLGLGEQRLDRLTAVHVQAVVNDLVPRVSARTIHKSVRILRQAMKKAVKQRIIAYDPTEDVDLPQIQKREMLALGAEEARRFIRACDAHDAAVTGSTDGRTARRQACGLVFVLTLSTGMRPGEVLALRWEDCDLDAGLIHVRQNLVELHGARIFGPPKTEKGKRRIPLPSSLAPRLRAHRRAQAALRLEMGSLFVDRDLVFSNYTGGPLDSHRLTHRDLKTIVKSAGLPEALRWYDLRHSAATIALGAGEPVHVVADLLGHQRIELTLNEYAHALPSMKDKTMRTVERLLFAEG